MTQILPTNDNEVNAKVDPWVRDICIAKDYKIKRHYTAAGNITFTINKKPFASFFFDRMDDFTQHTMIIKSKIRKMSTYGPVVNKKGIAYTSKSDMNKVKLYDLTMINFVNAERSPNADIGLHNVAITTDDDIYAQPMVVDSFIQDAVYTRMASDILYESKKLGIPHEVVLYNILEKLIERANS